MAGTSKKLVNSGVMRLVALALAGLLVLLAVFIWFNTGPWVSTVSERAQELEALTVSDGVENCIETRTANIDRLVEQEVMTAQAGDAAREDIEATCYARGEPDDIRDRTREQVFQESTE